VRFEAFTATECDGAFSGSQVVRMKLISNISETIFSLSSDQPLKIEAETVFYKLQ
jgi:hypothetical protein